MTKLLSNGAGGYAFLPGIPAFSEGMVALPHYSVVHARFHSPTPLTEAYKVLEKTLHEHDRPIQALCGVELRIPEQMEIEAFRALNKAYVGKVRDDWKLFVDGVNPVPRCNVALTAHPVTEPSMHGFSFTVEEDAKRPHFVTAGINDAVLVYGPKVFQQVASGEGLVRTADAPEVGDISAKTVEKRLKFILSKADARLRDLGVTWKDSTQIEIYLGRPLHDLLEQVALPEIGVASRTGLRWFAGLAPFIGPEAELDVRGFSRELILDFPL